MESTETNAASARPDGRGLYTYLVSPIGPTTRITDADGRAELRFMATLTRRDGGSRAILVVTRPTQQRPDLVERADRALSKGTPIRMVVSFERTATNEGGISRIRPYAIVDTVLDGARTGKVDDGQIEMFG